MKKMLFDIPLAPVKALKSTTSKAADNPPPAAPAPPAAPTGAEVPAVPDQRSQAAQAAEAQALAETDTKRRKQSTFLTGAGGITAEKFGNPADTKKPSLFGGGSY